MIYEKFTIPRLEIHVSHFCNLKCDNCNHFSNYNIKGFLTLEQFIDWNKPWVKKIFPKTFQLLGGEPTANPDLISICNESRNIWVKSRILLITNGFFLKNHPDLPETLEKNNIQLVVSIHDDSEEYTKRICNIKETISSWQEKYKFNCSYRESFQMWYKTFKKDENDNTIPFHDNNPQLSYKNCLSKEAKQLFNGNIYKCPPLTYLNLIKQKYSLSSEWDFYLNYKPLTPNSTIKEIKDFFSKKSEQFCNMCASNPIKYKKQNPLLQLGIKKF